MNKSIIIPMGILIFGLAFFHDERIDAPKQQARHIQALVAPYVPVNKNVSEVTIVVGKAVQSRR